MKLTEEQIKDLSHIETSEIEQDLRDTEREMKDCRDELDVLIRNRQGNRVRIYYIEGRLSSRERVCEKMREILEYRKRQLACG
jgi:hypothetical protein